MTTQTPKIAIAPMLDWSDRHYRFFMRQITKHTTLYTEMVVADAAIHGERDKLLGFSDCEQPLVLQLGGSDPSKLVNAAKISYDYGYREINLNCGCPSDKVQSGSFGACLMREPQLVADCVKALQDALAIPITVKHRIGLDYDYNYDYLVDFVGQIAAVGCTHFVVHARNAILKGLTPKANRDIPPLRYDFVYRLKQDFPELEIMINGGIKTKAEIDEHFTQVNGVMLGREAYYNPYLFADFDRLYYGTNSEPVTRKQVAVAMIPYLEQIAARGGRLHHATRHMIGLYHGQPRAKFWRQRLTTHITQTNSLQDYIDLVEQMND